MTGTSDEAGEHTALLEQQHITDTDTADTQNVLRREHAGLRSVLVFSLAFFLAFTAWHPLQNLESTIFHGGGPLTISGTVALGLTYGTNVLAAGTVAPIIVRRFGVKPCLLFQFSAFCLVVLANAYPRVWTVYPASIIAGGGSALLWVAEGHFITEVAAADSGPHHVGGSPKTAEQGVLGLYSGVFMASFALTQVAGNVISSSVLNGCRSCAVRADYILFAVFGCLLLSALVVVVLGIKSPPEKTHANIGGVSWRREISKQLWEGGQTIVEPQFLLLAPMIFANGMDGAFIFGDFTGQFLQPRVGEDNIGMNMSVFGAANTIAALVTGKLSDWTGRLMPLTLGVVFYCGTLVTIALAPSRLNTFLASATIGVGNGIIFTLTYSVLSDRYAHKPATAYGLKSIVENIAAASYFFISRAVPLNTKIWIGVGLNVLGIVALCVPTRKAAFWRVPSITINT
eukprot:m.50519 g.50519  ORF g.50519 m.50519 type:complete len:457 (-) comp9016_c0_seq1:2-1372(-)